MTIQKMPRKQSLMGMPWTMWPWPNLMIKTVFRKFAPKPAKFDQALYQRRHFQLSVLYCFLATTCFGLIYVYTVSGDTKFFGGDLQTVARVLENRSKGSQVMYVQVDGLRVSEPVDITEKMKKERQNESESS